MLNVETIRSYKIPRGISNQFKRLCWQELVGRQPFKKGQSKPGLLPIEEKNMAAPFLHRITALPGKARDVLLIRNLHADPVRPVFPPVQRADQSIAIHGSVTQISAEMRTTPRQHNHASGVGPITNESTATEFDINRRYV